MEGRGGGVMSYVWNGLIRDGFISTMRVLSPLKHFPLYCDSLWLENNSMAGF